MSQAPTPSETPLAELIRTASVCWLPDLGDCVTVTLTTEQRDVLLKLERDRARLMVALQWMREEYAKIPHSLGYRVTHIPKIDSLLKELTC